VELLRGCLLEPGLANAPAGERFQFVRQGYFIADALESKPGAPVFNRIVGLRDTYARRIRQQADSPLTVVNSIG